ncbi:MAG: hypothetical protein WD512_00500, partial [Candidatus Paceibacterota bacterium]
MSKCVYNYNGKEYSTKEELAEALTAEQQRQPTKSFTIDGSVTDLEIKEEMMRAEAIKQHGTDEFLSFDYIGDSVKITIDEQAIKDLLSGEKLLRNSATGKMESVNLDQVTDKEYDNYTAHKVIHEADKSIRYIIETEIPEIIKRLEGNTDLKEKLVNFAQKLGIQITTLENYLKDRAIRENVDINDIEGLADIFNKTIALAEGGNVDILAEEVAHFAVEYHADNEVMERMIGKVDQTDQYKNEADNYREVYRREGLTAEQVERKVRKEIIGKILAQKIKDNFNDTEATTAAEIGIINQLRDLWNQFLDLFRNQPFLKEFGAVLDEIAYNELEGETEGMVVSDSKEVYFNLSGVSKEIESNLKSIAENLEQQYRRIKRDEKFQGLKAETQLKEIRDALAENEYVRAVNAAIKL